MDAQWQKAEQVWKKIYGSYINVDSTDSTVHNYTKLATEYEEDFVGLGYDTPLVVAQAALRHLVDHGTATAILDVACGTGLVAEGLRKEGFEGAIDGVDGSSGMLSVARSKGKLYRNLLEALVTPNKKTPYADNSYDCIVVSGGYGLGHLMPETINELVRVTKKNGLIVFTVRYNTKPTRYEQGLNAEIEKLCKSGAWIKVNDYRVDMFKFDLESDDAVDKALKATIHCFKKC